MKLRYMAATSTVALLACAGRSSAPAVAIDADADAVVPATEPPPPWRVLADMEVLFQAPPPSDVSGIAAQPSELPQSAVTAHADFDGGPDSQWYRHDHCSPPLAPKACASVTECYRSRPLMA